MGNSHHQALIGLQLIFKTLGWTVNKIPIDKLFLETILWTKLGFFAVGTIIQPNQTKPIWGTQTKPILSKSTTFGTKPNQTKVNFLMQ